MYIYVAYYNICYKYSIILTYIIYINIIFQFMACLLISLMVVFCPIQVFTLKNLLKHKLCAGNCTQHRCTALRTHLSSQHPRGPIMLPLNKPSHKVDHYLSTLSTLLSCVCFLNFK